jgi:hypothetical protein
VRKLVPVVLAVLVVACAVPASAVAGEPPTRNCGWHAKISGDQLNLLYPDQAAKYWVALLPIPPGGHVEVAGRYPHARYISLHVYNPTLSAIDALADEEIAPDAGSLNPFLPGADRTAANRSYRVRVVNERAPSGPRAPNTIYTTSADGEKTSQFVASLAFRVYVPDRGRDDSGGVGLPALALVTADGTRIPLPECPAVVLPDLKLTEGLASLGAPIPSTEANPAPPLFRKHVNVATSLVNALVADNIGEQAAAPLRALTLQLPSGGFGENLHNKYIAASMRAQRGQVLALRAKAPTTPATENGEPTMGAAEMRYWSFCTNIITTSYLGCVNDNDVPLHGDRRFTIVVSTAAARPANARRECGVAWLPAGPLTSTVLIFRHMLPDPAFPHSVQRAELGTEEATLGEYYPRGQYYPTRAAFEALGCPAT